MSTELPVYPRGDLDQGQLFLANLGSFWTDVFDGVSTLSAHFQGQLTLLAQQQLRYLDTIATLSRFTCPIFKRELWRILTINKNEINSVEVAPVTYGDGTHVYGDGLSYNQAQTVTRYRFPIPTGLVDVKQIMNRPAAASVILTSNVEFQINATLGYIEFASNPFEDPLWVTRYTVDSAGDPDEAMALWLFAADYDMGTLYAQYGYALSLYMQSSTEAYRDLINAYWDSLLEGPSELQLRRAIAAVGRLPVVREAHETVEAILDDPRRLQVVTDKNVYDFAAGATATVAVGDELLQGDFLTDAVDLINAADPGTALQNVAAISVGQNLSTLKLRSPIAFRNSTEPLVRTVDSDGFVDVTFAGISGFTDDIAAFWAYVAAEGRTTGVSLAQLLRIVEGSGQPRADELPATVNPMDVLIRLLLTSGVYIVTIKTDQLGEDAKLGDLTFLRQILPAHVLLLFIVSAQLDTESYTESSAVADAVVGFLGSEDDMTEAFASGARYTELTPRLWLVEA